MSNRITITVDLEDVSHLRIDGMCSITLPEVGLLEALTTPFNGVTLLQISGIVRARGERAKADAAAHNELVAKWKAETQERLHGLQKERKEFEEYYYGET